ncbi:TonB-dependent receptor [Xanthomonas sp. A2111]|uniref:TonB-dependent receptor n=1 Tax=Xanthomonas hawaiiensis TaxID=3003247 RepID=A0ABU2I4M6_9XANT|nr:MULTISPECIES: TonB-dependent receptor [unclassified Xanthomonas]MBO9830136.1 TonB-dependent receptor [Xanthomonas sp. A2111]MBO9873637.1 TonB-dependent receptor [Xanthomonas sp. D-93]MDS9992347.1 TonB-dependent receptor [Xanthomonas sp. A2111]WNH44136.1 TonB-dependent receptor [Xanthomonas sp. A6251]
MPYTPGPSTPSASSLALAVATAIGLLAAPARAQTTVNADDAQITALDRVEVTATPIPGTLIDADLLPYTVQTANADDIARSQAGNLTDFLLREMNGVDTNEVQGSPFQTDLTFRGFRASALPGASQGVSVYLDGVRMNEPFADIVSWDMMPEAAIRSVALMPGSNPLFGPNTLGGALAFTTQSGLTAPGLRADLSVGSGARKRLDASYGYAGRDGLHAFVAVTGFDENGWRDASAGRLGTVFGKLGRQGDSTDWDVSLLHGRSRLVGNGLLPSYRYTDEGTEPGLYEADRAAVYTSPDLTRNRNTLLTGQFDHRFDERTALHLLAYYRQGRRDTVNGDINDDYEEFVDDCADGYAADGTPLDAGCTVSRADADALHSGVLNTTQMRQHAEGVALNLSRQAGAHALSIGATYDRSRVRYRQYEQEAFVQDDRSVVADPEEDREFFSGVDGRSNTLGLFAADTWEVSEGTHVSGALRWNRVAVANTLSTADDGVLPRERFVFAKANPSLGITQRLGGGFTAFASASQNSRAPTAIELGCADPEQPCRLPTGLQADPRLEQIVSRTYELGLRWNPSPAQTLNASLYRADNRDDILFLRAPNSQQGYFDNVDRTRYQGADLSYRGSRGALRWFAGYSYLDATYRSTGELLSGERTVTLRPGTRIAGLPRNTLKLGVEWQALAQLALGADLRAVSRRVASGNEDGLVEDPEEGEAPARHDLSTGGYALLDLHGTWELAEGLSLYLRVNNVFDRRYETYAAIAEDLFPGGALARPQDAAVEDGPSRFVAPGAPRQYQIGLRWRF